MATKLASPEINVQAAGTADPVTVTSADIQALPFDDAAFDLVTGGLQTSCKSYRQG